MNLNSPRSTGGPPRSPSFGKGPTRPAPARPDQDFLSTTQRELNALLRRVRAAPELPRLRTQPSSNWAPADWVSSQPTSPESPTIRDNQEDSRRPIRAADSAAPQSMTVPVVIAKAHAKSGLITMGIALAAFALLALGLHLAAIDRISQIAHRFTALQQVGQGLDKLVAQRLATQCQRINDLSRHLDEARYPSAPFKDAQDLMAAGRFLDAEAAYGALLASRPTSSLSPIIAGNSAVANAALGRCQMVRTRLAQLRAMRPQDSLLARSDELLAECARKQRETLRGHH